MCANVIECVSMTQTIRNCPFHLRIDITRSFDDTHESPSNRGADSTNIKLDNFVESTIAEEA